MKNKIRNIRLSCQIVSQILGKVSRNLKSRKTEKEVANEIRKLAKTKADGIAFQPIVAFGRNSAIPHHRPTVRKLKKGDVAKIDLGVKFDGFCSDLTRTFFTSEPTKLQLKVYKAVLRAQQIGIRRIKIGAKAKDLDAAAREFLARKGFAKNFIHSLGHGVGRKIHEAPKIGPTSKAILEEGAVITIEPGIYLKGKFGVRIEDTILLKKSSVEILTKFPKKLTILKI
ncbi:M24 family metallopeptidase [Candidatus Gracilibacteria bacterium]|nr:M24 family metallopeptidase [Candidatus Gracilibacteria bacterium]